MRLRDFAQVHLRYDDNKYHLQRLSALRMLSHLMLTAHYEAEMLSSPGTLRLREEACPQSSHPARKNGKLEQEQSPHAEANLT